MCSGDACTRQEDDRTACAFGNIATKAAIVADKKAESGRVASCALTQQDALNMRAYGILDGYCSSTLQVNAVLSAGFGPETSCSALLRKTDASALSDADIILFIRAVKMGRMTDLPPEALRSVIRNIVSHHPDIDGFLEK